MNSGQALLFLAAVTAVEGSFRTQTLSRIVASAIGTFAAGAIQ
eukprot:CAMPEP_0172782554 /NCGR_PEP_ID=MMETSP1074-20121228/203992_1 /TAXON_ID=2916 /ORGANISM="Ceratium fusus, Strain PA161109" /LENGTH=42 /DNA_ID= /DNA_START= /DNA_END= /DNA_ORIENTATION=